MIEFRGVRILLDIEGTTSDIAFVRDVLFPYARREVAPFLERHSSRPAVQSALNQMAIDAGTLDLARWCPHPFPSPEAQTWIGVEVGRLMDVDSKKTGLKALQGLIWESGYRDGTLRAHVYPEVPTAFRRWTDAGLSLAIYSSGSIPAQKLLFAHTIAGDLTPFLSAYHDTTSGPKRAAESYRTIAAASGLAPAEMLFLSDISEELDAAREAGLRTGNVVRPEAAISGTATHPVVSSFDEISALRA